MCLYGYNNDMIIVEGVRGDIGSIPRRGIARRSFLKKGLTILLLAAGISAGIYGYTQITPHPRRRRVSGERFQLPNPRVKGGLSVEEALAKRRSIREYKDEGLTIEEVSQLLWAAQGITEPRRRFRAAPSAGATYPLETYTVFREGGVEGFEAGVYHYEPRDHSLTQLSLGDVNEELMEAAVDQEWVGKAPLNIVLTAIFERTTWRYGERGIRYVYMEAGHVGENIYLQATAMGLGTVVVGAFYDEEVREILGIPEEETPLYIIPVGRPKRG